MKENKWISGWQYDEPLSTNCWSILL